MVRRANRSSGGGGGGGGGVGVPSSSAAQIMEEPLRKKFKAAENEIERELEVVQEHLLQNCLCSLPDDVSRKLWARFHSTDVPWSRMTADWSTDQILMLVACVQLVCEKTMKQSASGVICSKIADARDALSRKSNDLVDYLVELADDSDQFVCYAASRALTSFLLVLRSRLEQRWLDRLTRNVECSSRLYEVSFSLDVLKRIVECKEFDEHTLDDDDSSSLPSASSAVALAAASSCHSLSMRSEHFDSTQLKCVCVKALESRWPNIVDRFAALIRTNSSVHQATVIVFLNLWEAIISVKANLSIVDTKPFYCRLDDYVKLLFANDSPIVWKHVLSLLNEVLCYGSTLALQHDVAPEPSSLAHAIVRSVKDRRLLRPVPYANGNGGFGGGSGGGGRLEGDRVLLKKLVLLVLKAVAVTVKEAKYDSSSDSSVNSEHDEDEDSSGDMALICRSIRDVLKKLDVFVKERVDFHPETSLAQWIVQLFTDQDDYLVESMICCVDVARVLCYRNQFALPDLYKELNPSVTFLHFLMTVSFDAEVLLDYLVSNETCFLLYILNFLKYAREHWHEFARTCGRQIRDVMNLLDRLRKSVDRLVLKNLFPYNINPILTLLAECHRKYVAYPDAAAVAAAAAATTF